MRQAYTCSCIVEVVLTNSVSMRLGSPRCHSRASNDSISDDDSIEGGEADNEGPKMVSTSSV